MVTANKQIVCSTLSFLLVWSSSRAYAIQHIQIHASLFIVTLSTPRPNMANASSPYALRKKPIVNGSFIVTICKWKFIHTIERLRMSHCDRSSMAALQSTCTITVYNMPFPSPAPFRNICFSSARANGQHAVSFIIAALDSLSATRNTSRTIRIAATTLAEKITIMKTFE